MPAVVPRSARPDARPEVSPDALLVALPPAEAYAADVARLGGRAPLGPADDAWLLVAHALARAAECGRADRGALFALAAQTIAALLREHGDERTGTALAVAADALAAIADAPVPEAMRATTGALQTVVAQQEQVGAFHLAFSTLTAIRQALAPVLDARSRGLLLAQQGRVARQLGALATATQLYRAAAAAGRRAGAPDVAARALLGAGALASNRGNYPESRLYFERARRAARRAGCAVLLRSSYHGLLFAAFAANDLDAALAHGWAAVHGLPDDATDERAEALLNLGEVGRQAGEHRAALGAALSALELTDLPRLRLPALGTAARAAAALGEHRLLSFLMADVERTVTRSGQEFENARAFVELAEAFDGLHNDLSVQYAARARALAGAGAFHEITARADAVLGDGATQPAHATGRPVRSARARAVLRTLETLPATARYERLVAC